MNPRDLLIHASVAGLLAAAAVTAVSTISTLADSGGGTRSVYVPIAPCRLADTRAGADNVGTRATPLAQTEIHTFQVWGTNGNCTIPTTATGIGTNVTAVNPTADGYLTIYPADVERPLASNLNWTPTSPPTPNQVTVGLSATGAISAYNNGGTIDVIIDIVGYYEALPASGTGPQGPPGPHGPVNRITNAQIALLRWDQDPGRAGTYATGAAPRGIAYDGTNIWVANRNSNTVSKINPDTGTRTDYPTGTNPESIAFDGTNVWVANYASNTVSKIDPTTGATINAYPTGAGPQGVAFDGISIWVTNFGDDTVSKIDPATGTRTDHPTGASPWGIAYDGTNIWVANYVSNTVSKIDPTTGVTINAYPTGAGLSRPAGVAYDGTNIWVTNANDNSVSQIDPATGAKTDHALNNLFPVGVAYDGTNIWVAQANGVISTINPNNGALTDYGAGSGAWGVVYDGTNIWVTNSSGDNVSKIIPG